MHTTPIHYSRPIIPDFFKGVSHEELKWTINYLKGLLEKPEIKEKEDTQMSISEAKAILSQRKLKSHSVPTDFNGMRDEVNPKYL